MKKNLLTLTCLFVLPLFGDAQNLIKGDSSFEVQDLGPCLRKATKEYAKWNIDDSTAAVGGKSIKVDFPRADQLWSSHLFAEDGTYTFSLYAKTDIEEMPAVMRVCGTGGEQAKPIVLTKNWERFSFTVSLKKGIAYLRFDMLQAGTLWLDGYQFEKGDKANDYKPQNPVTVAFNIPSENSNVFFTDEVIPVKIRVYSDSKQKSLTLKYNISNLNGELIKNEKKKITLNDENFVEDTFTFSPGKNGHYTFRASVEVDGRKISDTINTLAVVSKPEGIEKGIMPFCGVSCTSANYNGIKRMGARWVQMLIPWKTCQKTQDRISWGSSKGFDEIIRLKNMGFNTVCTILSDAPDWAVDPAELKEAKKTGTASGRPFMIADNHLKDFEDFVEQLVLRYRDYVDIYELGGEDNARYGQNPYYMLKYKDSIDGTFVTGPVADRMAKIYEISINEIRKLDKNKKIGLVRPTGVTKNRNCIFSREIFKRFPKAFDLYPIDPYTAPRSIGPNWGEIEAPEDFLPEHFAKSNALTKTYANSQPVYNSEIGFIMDIKEAPDSASAIKMAQYLARSFLLSKILGSLQANWFTTDDGIFHGKEAYGLWLDAMPMPLVSAFGAVSQIVENVTETKRIELGDGVWAAIFRKPGGADAAIWMTSGTAELRIPENRENYKILDMAGAPLAIKNDAGKKIINIGDSPVYFRGKGKDAYDGLIKLLSSDNFYLPPVKITAAMNFYNTCTVLLHNITVENIKCKMELQLDNKTVTQKNITLPAGKDEVLEIQIPSFSADKKSELLIKVNCQGKYDKPITAAFPLSLIKLHKVNKNIVIDGDISKWKDHPTSFIMNDSSQLVRPDWQKWDGPEDLSAIVYFGWDEKKFYAAADVTDDKHFNNAKRLGDIWNGDCFQLGIDTKSDGHLSTFKPYKERYSFKDDDKNIGIALFDGKTGVCAWGDKSGLIEKNKTVCVKRDEEKKKTYYEIAIPWTSLGFSAAPENKVMGLNFVIFDDDDGNGEKYYFQFAPGLAEGTDPAKFKKFLICK